jgi:4-diphosphocytidyl-2-C-methyl-D-erythritol kinase
MILFPPAKINLGLSILNKREDGYHNLETLMFQIPLCDILEIVKSSEFSFKSSGLEISGDVNSNLCFKAYQLIKEEFNIGKVSIHLHKNIPMGAGMGGGSSDGTYTLLLLNDLFDLKISKDKLRELALKLGSDCPLFVDNLPQFAEGRGEILSPFELNLKGKYIYLINIGIHVSTKDAFSGLNLLKNNNNKSKIKEILLSPLNYWKSNLKNDFEDSVFIIHPILREIKSQLYENGAIYASMTGSGSTIFAIFDEMKEIMFEKKIEKVFEKFIYVE